MVARVLTTGVHSLGPALHRAPLIEMLLLKHRHLELTPDHIYLAQGAMLAALRTAMTPQLAAAAFAAWSSAMWRLCQIVAAGVTPPAA